MTAEELLAAITSPLLNIADGIEDEGDRAFFASTNDADKLKEIAEQLNAWRFEQADEAQSS